MKDIQQLIKKNNQEGRYDDIFPKTYTDAVEDRGSGMLLTDILAGFNMYFLPYVGSKKDTRLQVPKFLRRRGLIITYVTYDNVIVTERYKQEAIDDITWGDDNSWDNLWDTSDYIKANNAYGFNVTVFGIKGGRHTIETAVLDVPPEIRVIGHKITFAQYDGTWATYQLQSMSLSDYTKPEKWVKLEGITNTGSIVITNQPDEEDITVDRENLLKFADKEYNESSFSGLGRVYLRKNIVDGKNVLTQEMISKANTRYIIQYDYDLNGTTITIPEGCVLEFQGGSLNNGKVIGNNTKIISGILKIFGTNITLSGTWDLDCVYPEWFGALGNNNSDDTNALQSAINLSELSSFNVELLSGKSYKITNFIELPSYCKLGCQKNISSGFWNNTKIIRYGNSDAIRLVKGNSGSIRNICIENISIESGNERESDSNKVINRSGSGICIYSTDSAYGIAHCKFNSITVFGFDKGLNFKGKGYEGIAYNVFNNCSFIYNNIGLIFDSDESESNKNWATVNSFYDCRFNGNYAIGIWYNLLSLAGNNIFFRCLVEGNGNEYDQTTYSTYGFAGIKMSNSAVVGPIEFKECYIENNIPYRTGTFAESNEYVYENKIYPNDIDNLATIHNDNAILYFNECTINSYSYIGNIKNRGVFSFKLNTIGRSYEYNSTTVDYLFYFDLQETYAASYSGFEFIDFTLGNTYRANTSNKKYLYKFSDNSHNTDLTGRNNMSINVSSEWGVFKFDNNHVIVENLYVGGSNGHDDKLSGLTPNNPFSTLDYTMYYIRNLISSRPYYTPIIINLVGDTVYNNADNDNNLFLPNNVYITSTDNRDNVTLTINATNGLICQGYNRIGNITLTNGSDDVKSLLCVDRGGANIILDYVNLNITNNLVLVGNAMNNKNSRITVRSIVFNGTVTTIDLCDNTNYQVYLDNYFQVNGGTINDTNYDYVSNKKPLAGTITFDSDNYPYVSQISSWKRFNNIPSASTDKLNNLSKEMGDIFYNTTLGKCVVWSGSAWTNVDGTALLASNSALTMSFNHLEEVPASEDKTS